MVEAPRAAWDVMLKHTLLRPAVASMARSQSTDTMAAAAAAADLMAAAVQLDVLRTVRRGGDASEGRGRFGYEY